MTVELKLFLVLPQRYFLCTVLLFRLDTRELYVPTMRKMINIYN